MRMVMVVLAASAAIACGSGDGDGNNTGDGGCVDLEQFSQVRFTKTSGDCPDLPPANLNEPGGDLDCTVNVEASTCQGTLACSAAEGTFSAVIDARRRPVTGTAQVQYSDAEGNTCSGTYSLRFE